MGLAKTIEDYKAVSMNVMHSSMKITDEFYSNLNDNEVQKRIDLLNKGNDSKEQHEEILDLLNQFLSWKKNLH